MQFERVAGDPEAHRTRGHVHVPDFDPVRGGSGKCALHQRHAHPSHNERDSRVLPSAGRENRHSTADAEYHRTESAGHGTVVVLSPVETIQVSSVEIQH